MKKRNCKNIRCSRKIASNISSTALFIGCTIFVAIRGYKCFDKYLNEPEAVDISYKFSGILPFPSITICTKKEDTFNLEVLNKCQLSKEEYLNTGPLIGNGSSNCTDPKILYNQVSANIETLGKALKYYLLEANHS